MIIGVCGPSGSGKDTVADFFISNGFRRYSLSDCIREECQSRGIELTRDNQVKLGDEMREKCGSNYWAKEVLEKVKGDEKTVLVSIRTLAEVEKLKENGEFFLIAVNAPLEVRYDRNWRRKSARDGGTFEEFKHLDYIERNGKTPGKFPQEINHVMEMADFLVDNSGTKEELEENLQKIVEKIEELK